MKSNIVLIGMPGSGKSTVGVLLAKQLSLGFIDTDLLIQYREGRALQQIVDCDGYLALRRIEEEVLLALQCRDHVIATGGSAAYSMAAMQHLKANGTAVFLHADLVTLQQRVHDYATRGVAKRPDQTLADLFAERLSLYRRYADITIDSSGLNHEEVCCRIVAELQHFKKHSIS